MKTQQPSQTHSKLPSYLAWFKGIVSQADVKLVFLFTARHIIELANPQQPAAADFVGRRSAVEALLEEQELAKWWNGTLLHTWINPTIVGAGICHRMVAKQILGTCHNSGFELGNVKKTFASSQKIGAFPFQVSKEM